MEASCKKLGRARTAGVRKVLAIEKGSLAIRRGITVIRDDVIESIKTEAAKHLEKLLGCADTINISRKVMAADEIQLMVKTGLRLTSCSDMDFKALIKVSQILE